jgi:hypothetical protein
MAKVLATVLRWAAQRCFLKPLENVFETAEQMAKVLRWADWYIYKIDGNGAGGLLSTKMLLKRWDGRRRGFKGRLVPNVAL